MDKHVALVEQLYEKATDKATSGSTLKKLSYLSDTYILTGLALNPSTPVEVLKRFLELFPGTDGTDEEMRLHIVSNQSLSDEILKRLSENDKSQTVRETALAALIHRK